MKVRHRLDDLAGYVDDQIRGRPGEELYDEIEAAGEALKAVVRKAEGMLPVEPEEDCDPSLKLSQYPDADLAVMLDDPNLEELPSGRTPPSREEVPDGFIERELDRRQQAEIDRRRGGGDYRDRQAWAAQEGQDE